jgi:formylglycine-generating enzyme required for sulfatase activity
MKERGEQNRPGVFVQDDVWRTPGYDQQPDYPVVGVTWYQAQAFCKWLTKKERAAGMIGPEDVYRLPTDAEWTAAAGPGKYPWGNHWPPPPKSGNFADETWAHGMGYKKGFNDMQGYTDDHGMVAPVGSYAANRFGLFDMAGNVAQWCQDKFRLDMIPPDLLEKAPGYKQIAGERGEEAYLMRGSSWQSHGDDLLSYWRLPRARDFHPDVGGFRCVLEVKSQPRSPAAL